MTRPAVHSNAYGLTPVIAPQLQMLEGIQHGFFTRPGGVSKGIYQGLNAGLGSADIRENVIENRRRISSFFNIHADQIASPYQKHTADALITERAFTHNRPEVDALVTRTKGLALGIVTADCGPVLFADPIAKVIGAAHAGWKGALGGVLEDTIAKMEQLGAKRAHITAVLGPMISPQNYEVGPDFPQAFKTNNSGAEKYFTPSAKAGHYMFDLMRYIVERLQENGVQAFSLNRCTYAEEENFYSYRRTTHRKEADYGRQLSAIILT